MSRPKLSEELYQFYPSMSAQTHEAEVKDYAREYAAFSNAGLLEALKRIAAESDGWQRDTANDAIALSTGGRMDE